MAARVASRAMSTIAQRSGGGAVAPWKPKIAVYRHLSPFEMNPVTPFSKWLKEYRAKAVENYHWSWLFLPSPPSHACSQVVSPGVLLRYQALRRCAL